MLNQSQLEEIRTKLEASQNPLFFYDNDVDGLCSFLILKRALDRGRGVAIKSFPDLKEQYTKKVDELNPDTIIILDKAELSPEFASHAEEKGIPIIWIDHHETKTTKEIIQKTSYYNTYYSTKSVSQASADLTAKQSNSETVSQSEPVSFVAQKIFNRPQDLWLGVIGCIGDVYMPDFAKKFSEENPDLLPEYSDAFTALQTTTIGKIARMLNFGLMDTTTNVVNLTKYLSKATTPYDILEENPNTKQFHKRANQLEEFFQKQIQKAKSQIDKKSDLIFFAYSGNTSMSSEIANKLVFNNKDKLVVVAFLRPEKANISVRGKNALEITKKATKDILGATGGGHEEATGAMVPIIDFEKFKSNILHLTQ